MDCDFSEKVSLLIDGELSPIEALAVERHLVACAECLQARADFLTLRSQLDTHAPVVVAAPRRELARLLARRPAAGQAEREAIFSASRWKPAVATAVMLFLAGVIALLAHFKLQPHRDSSNTVVLREPHVAPANSGSPVPTIVNSPSLDPKQASAADDQRQRSVKESTAAVKPPGHNGLRIPPVVRRLPALQTREAGTPDNVITPNNPGLASNVRIQAADTETLTAQHLVQSELLLRDFRNLRPSMHSDGDAFGYERRRAEQLFYQNVLLRREADTAGDVQLATLLENLEPILLDIAHLTSRSHPDEVLTIKARVERQNLVALLQINSTSLTRAND